jgi:uncharacterized protein (TIGR02118 family)
MYKLVILIKPLEDVDRFEENWPKFLNSVEKMPGLVYETTSRVDKILYGDEQIAQIHELFFESQKDAVSAMSSPEGREAGKILQQITGGRIGLFFADHKGDDLDNIRKFRQEDDASE